MSELKMGDVFGLPLIVCRTNPQMITAKPTYNGRVDFYYATIRSPVELEVNYAVHAINNHDRLEQENAELREVLEQLVSSSEENEKQLNELLMCNDYGESEALCKARQLLNK